jgi:hypothetical protein
VGKAVLQGQAVRQREGGKLDVHSLNARHSPLLSTNAQVSVLIAARLLQCTGQPRSPRSSLDSQLLLQA